MSSEKLYLVFFHDDVKMLQAFEASPPFAKSDMMGKRMTRMKRIKTDFFPPAAKKDEPKASQDPF